MDVRLSGYTDTFVPSSTKHQINPTPPCAHLNFDIITARLTSPSSTVLPHTLLNPTLLGSLRLRHRLSASASPICHAQSSNLYPCTSPSASDPLNHTHLRLGSVCRTRNRICQKNTSSHSSGMERMIANQAISKGKLTIMKQVADSEEQREKDRIAKRGK